MGIERFFITPVTILTAPTITDTRNNLIRDWTDATGRDTKGWLSQNDRAEVVAGREAVVTGEVLFLAADDPVTVYDRVQVDGTTYDVDGQIRTARTPRGDHHLEVQLRAVEG